jgi:hypothetical protein
MRLHLFAAPLRMPTARYQRTSHLRQYAVDIAVDEDKYPSKIPLESIFPEKNSLHAHNAVAFDVEAELGPSSRLTVANNELIELNEGAHANLSGKRSDELYLVAVRAIAAMLSSIAGGTIAFYLWEHELYIYTMPSIFFSTH